jgi:WxcM-like, C-terminal
VEQPPERGIEPCRLISLPRVEDGRGNLTFIESGSHIDFEIERVYYLYDVPGGADRGGHAHRTLKQLLVAVSGSFDVIIDQAGERERFHLNRAYTGLYIPPMTWREIDNFSGGSVCLALASAHFDEDDYIREYDEYLRAVPGATPASEE